MKKKIFFLRLVPDPFTKNQSWAYLWINNLKYYNKVCFYWCPNVTKCISKLRCRPLVFTFTASFSEWFLKKNMSHVVLFLTKFHCWLPLVLAILANMSTVIICFPVCYVINFEINLSLLVRPFFYITKKSREKCKNHFRDRYFAKQSWVRESTFVELAN